MGKQNGVASGSLWYEITLYLYWWSFPYHRLKWVLLRYNHICILLLLWVFTLGFGSAWNRKGFQSVISMELKVWRQQLLKCSREKRCSYPPGTPEPALMLTMAWDAEAQAVKQGLPCHVGVLYTAQLYPWFHSAFPIGTTGTLPARHVLKGLMDVSLCVCILYVVHATNRSLIWGVLYVLGLGFQRRNK